MYCEANITPGNCTGILKLYKHRGIAVISQSLYNNRKLNLYFEANTTAVKCSYIVKIIQQQETAHVLKSFIQHQYTALLLSSFKQKAIAIVVQCLYNTRELHLYPDVYTTLGGYTGILRRYIT